LWAPSPYPSLAFGYSSTKSRRINAGKGIDNIGIKPQKTLSYEQDWIAEARKYLER